MGDHPHIIIIINNHHHHPSLSHFKSLSVRLPLTS